MSAVHVDPASRMPLGSEPGRDNASETGVLFVYDVPRPVLRALSSRGAEKGMSRSTYVRKLVEWHTTEAGA